VAGPAAFRQDYALAVFRERCWRPPRISRRAPSKVDYEARRVMIDQNHKLIANIDNVIATSNNAIAAEWHSHWRQAGYDYREDHKEATCWSISFVATGRRKTAT
jgi:hypothetical protein